MVVFLFLTWAWQGWEYNHTRIFDYLPSNRVAITPGQEVYILAKRDKKVIHLSANGERLADIGGSGQGPGSFGRPTDIFWDDGYLYVLEKAFGNNRIQKLEPRGGFIEVFPLGALTTNFHKIKGGWAFFEMKIEEDGSGMTGELVLANESLDQRKTLAQWPIHVPAPKVKGTSMAVPYSPAPDGAAMASSPDGLRLYFYKPGLSEFRIFHCLTKEHLKTVKLNEKPVRFDKDWGERQFQKLKQRANTSGTQFVLHMPEYFPAIGTLRLGVDHKLWVFKGTYNYRKSESPLIFDLEGERSSSPLVGASIEHILAIIDGWAFMTHKNEEGEMGIRKKRWEQVLAVLGEPH